MQSPILVVTDLDGTLLDHHDYTFTAANDALSFLKQHHIPVVINSSKTAAEILTLRQALSNSEPYVVENGGGIHIPIPDSDLEEKRVLGMNRAEVLQILKELRGEKAYSFVGFEDMSISELSECTGLDNRQAELAKLRDYSEPLLWKDSEARFIFFAQELEARGLSVVRGGRFIHIAAPVDKGKALPVLSAFYEKQLGKAPIIVALGDGNNDVAMLQEADYPILIPSPTNALPKVSHEKLKVAEGLGPIGWNTSVIETVNEIFAEPN